jgi:hypothetical protein
MALNYSETVGQAAATLRGGKASSPR